MNKCFKCNDGEMELGTVSSDPHIYFVRTKTGPREGYHIDGYRCSKWGYVEYYATRNV